MCNSKLSPIMQLSTILYAALAAFAIGVEASPIRHSEHDAAKHPPKTPGHDNSAAISQGHSKEFKPVSSPPKIISARSDDEDFVMSGTFERAFDVISPPPKISAAAPAVGARAETFDSISPPPKTRPSLYRRVYIRASGFIGNLVNKWMGRRQTTTSSSNSSSSELTSYQQNGPST
jgi:hypothetical protein